MNVIADRLFGLLLGWTRGLFNSLWNLVTNHSSGIVGFFERFWLPMIVILLLVGTLADYIVWIIRWRPYYVWRSWFMRRDREKRMQATQAYMTDLDQAPLDLELDPMEAAPFTPMFPADEAVVFPPGDDFPYPHQAPDEQPPHQEQPVWQPQELVMPSPDPGYAAPEPELPFAAWTVPPEEQAAYQEPEALAPAWDQLPVVEAEDYHLAPEETTPEKPASRRRRRIQTKRQRQPGLLRTLRETLIDPTDPSEQLDSLPPPISQEDAFHQPYYPENYRYRPAPSEEEDGSGL
jgi:hypothetical protein